MRRRSHLAVTLVALLMVGASIVTTTPRGSALAADPQHQLAATQAQLADAQAARESLQATLDQQRTRLAELQSEATNLASALDVARAQLADVASRYEQVAGLLVGVRGQVDEMKGRLNQLNGQIAELDAQLKAVAAEITQRTAELHRREALLQDHLRSAYAESQTSLLEVLLSASSLDDATTQMSYMLTVSEQDSALAEEIRTIRAELDTRQRTLESGRRALDQARLEAAGQANALHLRERQLASMEAQLAALKAAADEKRVQQEAALNASLQAKGDVEAQIAAVQRAAAAQERLVSQLQNQAAALQAQIDEARRRAAAEAAKNAISASGFQWPEAGRNVTQEWGPTSYVLEPSYTYQGTYYPHFHAGIDIANGCGTPEMAAKEGVVVASGQPLYPFDTGFGVVIQHEGNVQTWYWHMQPRMVVAPGQIVLGGTVVGYEGSTGNSTGCHLHFATNVNGVWENPRNFLL
ncbi:MAG: peptidoglycan DD-metalloendopeptidase family protein [Chloroflexota bacterium]